MIQQLRPITALMLSAFFMVAGVGLAGILIPLRATAEAWSTVTLGWIGASYAAAFTAGCVVVPRLVLRVGHIRVFAAMQTLLVASMLFHSLVVDPIAWALFRLMAGASVAGGYMVLESWLNERVTNETRGMVMSAYMIVSMAAVASGQYLAPAGDPTKETLFVICALLFAAAVLPVTLTSAQSPRPITQVSIDIKSLFKASPAAMVGAFMAGVVFSIWSYFVPVYGKMAHLSDFTIATMLAFAMLGGIIAQFPIGRLSDQMDRRYVMAGAGLFGAALCVPAAILAPATPWVLFGFTFALGMVLFPIYALASAHANDIAQPEDFVKISGGILIFYGFGTTAGPLVGGPIIDAVGKGGVFMTLGVAFAVYGGYAFWRSMRREAVPADERTDYQVITPAVQQTPESLQLDPRIEDVPEEERLNA